MFAMTTYAFLYEYDPSSPKIAENRPRHREFCAELKNDGVLIGSGPFIDGNGGALLVISLPESATIDDAQALMDKDPFYSEGAISKRTVHTWNPVLNVFGA
ncbi:hypothetical protein FRC0546_01352 [Corynebacterium diphtheriae]|nr:hypothetical protein FRC0546_01352 [Corynebacterium diphtheriae]